MSNITKISGVNFQNLIKFSTVEMEKIASFLHSTTIIEDWVDYLNQNLWSTGNYLATVSGSTIWIFGNITSTQQMARKSSKAWGQMGIPSKVRINIEKTNASDPDAVLDYILIRAWDSAGEPQMYSVLDYPPAGNITVTNTGLELEADLNWNQGTPPLAVQGIYFQPANTDPYDLKVTKLDFLDANDPTSYINTNPKFRHTAIYTDWTISGTGPIVYDSSRLGFVKISPVEVQNPPGQWQTGYNFYVDHTTTVYPGVRYVCIQDHVSASNNEPGTGQYWQSYWAQEYFYLTANGSWNVGFRPSSIVIASQVDTHFVDYQYGASYYIQLFDTDGNAIGNNTITHSTETGFMIMEIWPDFNTYGKDLYTIRLRKTDYYKPDFIRIRSIGFWYDD